MKFSLVLAVFCLALTLTGCSTIYTQDNSPPRSETFQSVFIIQNPYQRNNLDLTILAEIKNLGIPAKIGYPSENEKNNALIVNYFDSWSWDIVPYLRSLEIQLLDPTSDLIVARARFENHLVFHTYPSEIEKTTDLVKKIFQPKQP